MDFSNEMEKNSTFVEVNLRSYVERSKDKFTVFSLIDWSKDDNRMGGLHWNFEVT